jgi:hypothetical protein
LIRGKNWLWNLFTFLSGISSSWREWVLKLYTITIPGPISSSVCFRKLGYIYIYTYIYSNIYIYIYVYIFDRLICGDLFLFWLILDWNVLSYVWLWLLPFDFAFHFLGISLSILSLLYMCFLASEIHIMYITDRPWFNPIIQFVSSNWRVKLFTLHVIIKTCLQIPKIY